MEEFSTTTSPRRCTFRLGVSVTFLCWLSWWHNEPAKRLDDVDGMPCTVPRSGGLPKSETGKVNRALLDLRAASQQILKIYSPHCENSGLDLPRNDCETKPS